MKDLKNFGKELADALQEEAMSLISNTIKQSGAQKPCLLNSFSPKDKWLKDLVNGIIDGAEAVSMSFRMGRTDRKSLQVEIKKDVSSKEENSILLNLSFEDKKMSEALKTIFWGGELQETEVGGKKLSKTVVNGNPGFNEKAVTMANKEFLVALKDRLEKENPRIQKLMEEFSKATEDKK